VKRLCPISKTFCRHGIHDYTKQTGLSRIRVSVAVYLAVSVHSEGVDHPGQQSGGASKNEDDKGSIRHLTTFWGRKTAVHPGRR